MGNIFRFCAPVDLGNAELHPLVALQYLPYVPDKVKANPAYPLWLIEDPKSWVDTQTDMVLYPE